MDETLSPSLFFFGSLLTGSLPRTKWIGGGVTVYLQSLDDDRRPGGSLWTWSFRLIHTVTRTQSDQQCAILFWKHRCLHLQLMRSKLINTLDVLSTFKMSTYLFYCPSSRSRFIFVFGESRVKLLDKRKKHSGISSSFIFLNFLHVVPSEKTLIRETKL